MKEGGKDEGVGQNKGEDEESLLGRIKKNKKGRGCGVQLRTEQLE